MVQPNTVFCLGAMITGNQALFKKKKKSSYIEKSIDSCKIISIGLLGRWGRGRRRGAGSRGFGAGARASRPRQQMLAG